MFNHVLLTFDPLFNIKYIECSLGGLYANEEHKALEGGEMR